MTGFVSRVLRAAAGPPLAWRLIGDLYSTGVPGYLEWRNGALSGTVDALRDVDALVTAGRAIGYTPTGPFFKPDKHDETGAYVLALNVLRGSDVTGTPPTVELPVLPDGAIA